MIFPKHVRVKRVNPEMSGNFEGFASIEPEVGKPFGMLIIKGERTHVFHTSNVTEIKSWSNERVRIQTLNSEYEIEAA